MVPIEESSALRVSGMVLLIYKVLRDLLSCVHRLWYTHVVGEPYTSIQRVCKNSVSTRVVPMTVLSDLLVCGIVHLEYKAVRDLPNYEHSLW